MSAGDTPNPAPSDPGPQPASPSPPNTPPPASGADAAAPPAGEARVHLYEVAANQRERVLTSFDMQRAAILKAVADQRAAAVAPIEAVQARLAGKARAAGPATSPGAGATQAGLGPAAQLQANVKRPQAVAAEIVGTIKLLVAEEVRVQLQAVLRALQTRDTAGAASEISADSGADSGANSGTRAG